MSKLSAEGAYLTYLAVKLHFTEGTYDAFRFNFKGVGRSTGLQKSDKNYFMFEKLAQSYPNRDRLIRYLLSNTLAGNTWVRDMNDDVLAEWEGMIQSIRYTFISDLNKIYDYCLNHDLTFQDLLVFKNNLPIYVLYRRGTIRIETIVIIDVLTKFLSKVNKDKIADPLGYIHEDFYKFRQYKPFLLTTINTNKLLFNNVITETFTSQKK